MQKLRKAQRGLTNIYQKEQKEYIQGKINKIRNPVEDRQLRIAWQTVIEVIKRKSTSRAKLKAVNQKERIHMWKGHFKNLLGNSPKVTNKPITKIMTSQLDIKLEQFTQKKKKKKNSTEYLKKLKTEKLQASTKCTQKYGRQGNLMTYYFDFATPYINRIQYRDGKKGCILPFPEKGDLESPRTLQRHNSYFYRGWGLLCSAFCHRVEPEIEKVLCQNIFWRKQSTTSQIQQIIEGVLTKNLEATLFLADFCKAFDPIHRGKIE